MDGHTSLVGQFSVGAAEEVQAWILEHMGHPFIEIHHRQQAASGGASPTDTAIRIPATLLSELKRLVQRVEEHLIAQGLSDEFQTLEQLRTERGPLFAHASEAEFAKILDFYKIGWQYEPKTFPIQWDEQGRILESFTPDFYLPAQDLFIELTTQKQRLVTKKNRKIRLLRQLYPEVNIKIFYRRDVEQLRQKYSGSEKSNPGNLLTS
jgi:hypoxanthine phosphoribosyltransferase